jgi:hypothetical protein
MIPFCHHFCSYCLHDMQCVSKVSISLPEFGILCLSKPPEPVRGRVVRPAQEPRGRGVQDGVAAFVDATGLEFHCAYGNHQVPQPVGP